MSYHCEICRDSGRVFPVEIGRTPCPRCWRGRLRGRLPQFLVTVLSLALAFGAGWLLSALGGG